MRELAHWAAACAVALVVACGGGNGADDAGAPREEPVEAVEPADAGGAADVAVSGETIFMTNCATCHGEGGTGEGPAAVGLEPPPANLTDAEWVAGDGSYDAVRGTIEGGSPGTAMIGWKGTLDEAEIDAVTNYVLSLSGGS